MNEPTFPTTPLDAALWLARRGIPVFPCAPNGKTPLTAHGFQDATTNEMQILAWWRATPTANIGVPTGRRLDVLDIDGPVSDADAETLNLAELRANALAIVSTPRGGEHIYLPAILGASNRVGIVPHVDYRTLNGYVVVPPSRIGDRGYSWKVPLGDLPAAGTETPPDQLPEWHQPLAKLVTRQVTPPQPVADNTPTGPGRTTKYGQKALDGELERMREAQPGTRNDQLNRSAHSLAQVVAAGHLDRGDARDQLRDAALATGLDAAEVDRTLDSGFTAGEKKPRRVTMLHAVSGSTSRGHGSAPAAADSGEPGKGRPSVATQLVDLALDTYRLGVTPDGDPYSVPLTGPRIVARLRGGRTSLRAQLAGLYYDTTGRAATQTALTDALAVIEGRAMRTPPEPLHLRVGEHDGALWVDLGDDTGRAIRISGGTWFVEPGAPILFRRTAATAPLPVPVRGGSLDELWSLVNVKEADRPLVLAWLVAALLPDMPHAILVLGGEQGCGKTTTARTIVMLVDPSTVPTRKPPTDVNTWTITADGSYAFAVDNVSTIQPWWSDALARASTGDGDLQRELYKNNDMVVYAFNRSVILTGIDLGAIRDDLAERLLVVELERISETARQTDRDLAARRAEAHPRLLGAMLDLAAQVHQLYPDVKLDRMPRMADFAQVIAAVDQVLGTTGLDQYAGKATDLARDAVDADPILGAITATVTEPWTGTAGDLLAKVTPADPAWRPAKGWPANARAMTGQLKRRAPTLRRLGWTVDDRGRAGHDKAHLWSLTPPPAADVADVGADVADVGVPTSAAWSANVRTPDPLLTCEDVPGADVADVADVDTPYFSLSNLGEEREEGRAGDAETEKRDVPGTTSATSAHPHGTLDAAATPTGRVCPECGDPVVAGQVRHPRCYVRATEVEPGRPW